MSPLDLIPLPNVDSMLNGDELFKASFIRNLHEKVKA